MRFSAKHKFVYIAKPKCGSSTLRKILLPYSDNDDEIPSKEFPCKPHATALQVKRMLAAKDVNWAELFSFSMVRNPWAVLVSQFRYGLPDEDCRYFWDEGYFPRRPMSFDHWIRNHHTHWHTLENFTNDRDGGQLVKRVMLMENMGQEVRHLMKVLGLPQPLDIPWINSTVGGHTKYQDWYDTETRKFVAQWHTSDIECGGYTFEGAYRPFKPYSLVTS